MVYCLNIGEIKMFYVRNKETNKIYIVFAVQYNINNSTCFLIYKDNDWKWCISKYYEPIFTEQNLNGYSDEVRTVLKITKENEEINE